MDGKVKAQTVIVQTTDSGGSEYTKHGLLMIGVIMLVGKFILAPMGMPMGLLLGELFIAAVFLFLGLLKEFRSLGFALILTAVVVVVMAII